MSDPKSELLQKYILRVLELSEKRADALSEEELKEIAEEIGVSREILQHIEHEANLSSERGQAYFEARMWDKCQSEWQKAYELHPTEPMHGIRLGRLFLERYKETGKREFLAKATSYAESVLAIRPSMKEAKQLLLATRVKGPLVSMQTIKIVGILSLLIVLIGLLVFVADEEGWFEKPTGLEGLNYSVPIEWVDHTDVSTKQIQCTYSNIVHSKEIYDRGAFKHHYMLKFNAANKEYHRLAYEFSYIGETGALLDKQYCWIINSSEDGTTYEGSQKRISPELRPHENTYCISGAYTWPSSYFYENNPEKISKIIAKIHDISSYSAAASYSIDVPLEVEWKAEKPEGTSLTFYTRNQKKYIAEGFDFGYYDTHLIIENNGNTPITECIMEVSLDIENIQKIKTMEIFVLHGGQAPLLPGEKMAFFNEIFFRKEDPVINATQSRWSVRSISTHNILPLERTFTMDKSEY